MPASKQDKVLVPCPHCGHQQLEAATAISTFCKACGRYYRVQDVLKPAPKPRDPAPEQRRITCFDCGTELEVSVSAQSTMCKRCSAYIDLQDHHITHAVSKNFKTKGRFIIEPKGYVFNTESIVGEAAIKGRFLGKLVAERSLTVYSTADIKGSFTTALLIIPAEQKFRWDRPIRVGSVEVAGELVATLQVENTVTLKSTARFFGQIEAKNLIVESGAVVVANVRVAAETACPPKEPSLRPETKRGGR